MIIIEGMDNTGKSRIAEHLAQRFNLPLLHSPKSREDIIVNTLTLLLLNPQAVMDRFPVISERIYGPVIRGKIAFDSGFIKWQFYFEKLVKCCPLIFYCRPPEEKIFDFGNREQMEGVVEHRKKLLETYDTLMAQWESQLLIIKYDFTLPRAELFTEFIVGDYLLKRGMDKYEHIGR